MCAGRWEEGVGSTYMTMSLGTLPSGSFVENSSHLCSPHSNQIKHALLVSTRLVGSSERERERGERAQTPHRAHLQSILNGQRVKCHFRDKVQRIGRVALCREASISHCLMQTNNNAQPESVGTHAAPRAASVTYASN